MSRSWTSRFCMLTIVLTATIFIFFIHPNFTPAITNQLVQLPSPSSSRPGPQNFPVSFAYLISASKGDVGRLERVLRAVYHPANFYLLHLDLAATPGERRRLVRFVSDDPIFYKIGNVWVVRKSNLITYRGSTMLASTLHAMAMLLKACNWDWFINLSASDYPLITQDDLIYAFSKLPRDLNFIGHTSHLGWKLSGRAKPVMIDPGLYSMEKSEILWANEQRDLPTAFKLYTGSAWMVLSRSFVEYTIMGWDNLPRTLLLYYTNFDSSPEGYFPTLICNSKNYINTTINHDLHYISWDNPPKQHPKTLRMRHIRRMILSGAAFARKFKENDRVLDRIDRDLLHRSGGMFSRGGWCLDEKISRNETCSGSHIVGEGSGSYYLLRPGGGSRRLQAFISKLMSTKKFSRKQCK